MKMDEQGRVTEIDVNVKNFAEHFAKPKVVAHTTLKTWIIDNTGAAGAKQQQISDYEPSRLRLAIIVVDFAVAISTDPPTVSPEASAPTSPVQGGYLPVSNHPYEFFGPDAFWVNSTVAGAGRVVVIKEYC